MFTADSGVQGSAPFKVGVDLYPIAGQSPLGQFGKQDIYPELNLGEHGGARENNKHEILFHLNLFSKKPSSLGGKENPDFNLPFSFGR